MINVTDTPNPESKKFVFEFDLASSGSKEIKSLDECSGIKFAEKLFSANLSELIYIDTNFITIKKSQNKNWNEIVKKEIQEEVKKTKKKYSEDEINWLITCHQTNSRSTYKQLSAMFEVAQKKKIITWIITWFCNWFI